MGAAQTRPVLQPEIPDAQRAAAARPLPGIQPLEGEDWVTIDTAYAGQMAARDEILKTHLNDVVACLPGSEDAVQELLTSTLMLLDGRKDFAMSDNKMICPDGRQVRIDSDRPMETLGRLVAEDLCILQKIGDEHVLTAGLLCFPASWSLAEKIGRPLTGVHIPVEVYDAGIAARVQRLFDGVRIGQPIWRANLLSYADPTLFQPRTETSRRPLKDQVFLYDRSEKQVIFRLPKTDAVVFTIHTTIAAKPQPET